MYLIEYTKDNSAPIILRKCLNSNLTSRTGQAVTRQRDSEGRRSPVQKRSNWSCPLLVASKDQSNSNSSSNDRAWVSLSWPTDRSTTAPPPDSNDRESDLNRWMKQDAKHLSKKYITHYFRKNHGVLSTVRSSPWWGRTRDVLPSLFVSDSSSHPIHCNMDKVPLPLFRQQQTSPRWQAM